jgi:hypothetical protein
MDLVGAPCVHPGMRLAILFAAAALATGCTREPRSAEPRTPAPQVEPPPAVTPPPSVSPAPGLPTAEELDWQGPDGFPSLQKFDPPVLVAADGSRFEYRMKGTAADSKRSPVIAHVSTKDGDLWTAVGLDEFVPGAALAEDGVRLYVAEHSLIATGAHITAYDAATGAKLWSQSVQGIGPIAHSKYANRVTLAVIRGALVVFGNEAAGRYIEVYDPAGKMLSNRQVPR